MGTLFWIALLFFGWKWLQDTRKGVSESKPGSCQFTTDDPKAAIDKAEEWVKKRLGGPAGIDAGGGKLALEYWTAMKPKCPPPKATSETGRIDVWSVNGASWATVRNNTAQAIDEIDPGAPDFRQVARALLGFGLTSDL